MTGEGVRAELREADEIRECIRTTRVWCGQELTGDRAAHRLANRAERLLAESDALAEQVAQAEQERDDTIARYKGWTPDDVQRNVSRIVKERDEWIERAQDARAALARAGQREARVRKACEQAKGEPVPLMAAYRIVAIIDGDDPDGEHFPWHYTEFGVVCCCGSAMDRDENCLAAAALNEGDTE